MFLNDYSDVRLRGFCIYCGGPPETTEHVPSRFLLDNPLPNNLHVVDACRTCNNGFSNDEQYLGCLLEVVRVGSTTKLYEMREKVRRTLQSRPHWAHEIEQGRKGSIENPVWQYDFDRVARVIRKYAQGHAAYELAETGLWDSLGWKPQAGMAILPSMAYEDRVRYEASLHDFGFYPEVGSRALQRMFMSDSPWVVVQPDRYRYQATVGPIVRIVIGEYLAAEVSWDQAD